MAELVPQDALPPPPVAALGFAQHSVLEAQKARVPEKKRHRDAGDTVRREPVGREPEVRLEENAAPFELCAEALRLRVNRAARDLEAEIAEAKAQ
jgi:hypothetical protein